MSATTLYTLSLSLANMTMEKKNKLIELFKSTWNLSPNIYLSLFRTFHFIHLFNSTISLKEIFKSLLGISATPLPRISIRHFMVSLLYLLIPTVTFLSFATFAKIFLKFLFWFNNFLFFSCRHKLISSSQTRWNYCW